MNFRRNEVLELIEILKEKEINEICFKDIAKNINTYLSNDFSSVEEDSIYNVLNRDKDFFLKNNINIISHLEFKKRKRKTYIADALKHYSKTENSNIISFKWLQTYLKNTNNFNLREGSTEFNKYNLYETMEKLGLKFNSAKDKKKTTMEILKNFSETDIVQEYIEKNKKFTISKIHELIGEKLSAGTLYHYSIDMIQLGIPIKTNKLIDNNRKYDEKDIINKICTHLKEIGIDEIYAGQIFKFTRNLSLPNLGYKKIIEYKDLIKDIYGIRILELEKKDKEKDRLSNTLEKNKEYLKNTFNPNIKIVEHLPNYHNDKAQVLVIENIKDELKDLWLKYLEIYITKLSNNRIAVKNELIDINGNLTIDTDNKKIFFLLHDDLHINNLKISDIIKLSNKVVYSSDKLYGIHRQNMFLGFLIYLYINNKLLLSLQYIYETILEPKKAQTELDLFIEDFSVYNELQNAINRNTFNTKELKIMRFVYFFFMTINKDTQITNITNDYFTVYDQIDNTKAKLVKNILLQIGSDLNIENLSMKYRTNYYRYMKKERYKILINIFNEYMKKKVLLKETSIPDTYYKNTSSRLCAFLEFLDIYYPVETINKKFLKEIFNYPESKFLTYQEYIDKQTFSDSTKSNKISILHEIFTNTEGYEDICTEDKLIKYTKHTNKNRKAIEEDELIFKLDDILTNRPPKSDYFNNRIVNMDMSWWPHLNSVVPFEPLIIKLHLRIPSRGKSLREIDRESLLIYNNQGEISGFHFVSDKNKKRKNPYTVPNIWRSELSFLEQLIEYNKHYFPYLKRYIPKDITLKNGILPLFPNNNGTSTYPAGQHMKYWTKALIQAQMEFDNEGKNYNIVYSDEVDIPKTQEEFNKLTAGEFATFKRKYDLHSLRHTGITRNIRAGMPLELVRLLSGHEGFNTILTVYYHINHTKLVDDWLRKHKINITNELDMHKTSDLFIKKEFLTEDFKSKAPHEILAILKKYKFFFPSNRNIAEKNDVTLESISKSDPLFWKPLKTGICTRQSCPDNIIGLCSLCPYFLTNYMFTEEITIYMQLSMARTKKYSNLIISNREDNNAHKNSKLKQQMKDEIDVFIGYLEILSLADNSFKENQQELVNSNGNCLTKVSTESNKQTFSIIPSINIDHGYLEIISAVYKKNIKDDETVVDITNILANKILKYASKQNRYNEVEDLNNEEIVKWFLPQYEKSALNWQFDENKKESLINLLSLLDNKKLQLENKNENTLLAE